MKAMILAAGRGERMMPLTQDCPKPLLKIAGKPLIQHQIERLVVAGITDIVVNVSYLAEQLIGFLNDGTQFGARIEISKEVEALETAGGIKKALPLLGDAPFVVVNGDVWIEFDYSLLKSIDLNSDAHLVMVDNPVHNPGGDFVLDENGLLQGKTSGSQHAYTFSGVGVYSKKLFELDTDFAESKKLALLPVFEKAIDCQRLSGELYSGFWLDVGTPERFEMLNRRESGG